MPGLYTGLIPFHLGVTGALTVGTTAKRVIVPFAWEIEGVQASVNTPPTGASIILDVLTGANGTAPGGLASIYAVDTTKRPQIAAAAYDNTSTNAPFQPGVTGDTATEPSEKNYLAVPTAAATSTFAGNQPVNMAPNQPQSVQVNPTEPGSANQPNEAPNVRFSGKAGDVLQLAILQIGSGTAGSDLQVIIWVVEK